MKLILTILSNRIFILWPGDWVGIALLALGAALIMWGSVHWRSYQRTMQGKLWGLFGGLIPLALAGPLFLGFRIAVETGGSGLEPPDILVMLFIALPALVGGYLLGPASAALLGALSGFSWALFETHSPFTILEISGMALIFSAAVRQRYRTRLYQVMRFPALASLGLALLYPVLHFFSSFISSFGSIAETLDYTLVNFFYDGLAVSTSMILSGLIIEGIRISRPAAAGLNGKTIPSPRETNLRTRFLLYALWVSVFAIGLMMAFNWITAINTARDMLRAQVGSMGRSAAEEVPLFIDTGQELIAGYAEELDLTAPDIAGILAGQNRAVSFFSQFYLFDANQELTAAYPEMNLADQPLNPREAAGMAEQEFLVLALPAENGAVVGQISFLAPVEGSEGREAFLIGRVDLLQNPFTQSLLQDLGRVEEYGGVGELVDEDGQVIYTTDLLNNPTALGADLPSPDEGEGLGQDGKAAELEYREDIYRVPWSIVIRVPASRAQELALDLAAPMTVIILLLGVMATGGLYFGLDSVAKDLQALTEEVDEITRGNLDRIMRVGDRVDEVGRLRRAFEKMRRGLQARMGELNRLLRVSQGVASTLEIETSVQPILSAALETGARLARVVFAPGVLPEEYRSRLEVTAFGIGERAEDYNGLDEAILAMAERRSPLHLLHPARVAGLRGLEAQLPNGVILAVALREEQQYFGVLWLVYDRNTLVTESEMRFLSTLAGQAALAATNAQLFLRAEVERQRLATILTSTPDPVLVTDHRERLLLANPAAWEVLGLNETAARSRRIEDIVHAPALVELLRSREGEERTAEVRLLDGRVFQATASPVRGEERELGRVCVLRDISHLKKMDELKSEFVATVSHDLRSPLTLMRGYATMLEMVGDLNEQQMSYVRKIVSGIESMSHLVMNLLDLGRIEEDAGLSLERIPVEELINEVLETVRLPARQKNLDIAVDLGGAVLPPVEVDRVLFQQALHNLVENAIKYTGDGGRVTICCRVEGEEMVFEVEDTGVGISPVDQRRLFEKFYRVERAGSRRQVGMGLGLTIVKSIIEQHGGEIRVESELGKGSTFIFQVPLRH